MINPKSKKNYIMNLGTGKRNSVKRVINIIKHELKKKNLKIEVQSSYPEDTWGSYANISKLRSEGWRPKISLLKGAKLTINEFQKKK